MAERVVDKNNNTIMTRIKECQQYKINSAKRKEIANIKMSYT